MIQDNQLRTMFESITKNISEDIKDFKPLHSICDKYNQKPSHVVLIGFIGFLLLTLIGLFGHIFITIFGLIYPAYMTLRVPI